MEEKEGGRPIDGQMNGQMLGVLVEDPENQAENFAN